MVKHYELRDNIIPTFQNSKLANYLNANDETTINADKIISLYGSAIAENNLFAISLINLFVREYKIQIDKMELLESIYYAEARAFYRGKNVLYSLIDFGTNLEIQCEYIRKYWNMFE